MSNAPGIRRQSIRVALAATVVVGVVYLLIGAAVATFASVTLTADIDARLTQAFERVPPDLPALPPDGEPPSGPARDPGRPYGLRFQIWFVAGDGTVTTGENSPDLPSGLVEVTNPVTATVDGTEMRVAGQDVLGGRVVVAQSIEQVHDAQRTLLVGWLLIAPFLLGAVFAGAVIIGRRVAEPIEAARHRQLEFTADASHELRTPLSVIEAHTSLALAQERDATWYRAAFGKVDRESKRMRRLLEDMLWLARFDAAAAPVASEPVDLGTLARQAADRFSVVAETRRLSLGVPLPRRARDVRGLRGAGGPADRRARGQRLQVRARGRHGGRDGGRCRRAPVRDRGRLWPGDPGRGPGAHLRPLPPLGRHLVRGGRGRAGPRDRRRDRARHGRPLDGGNGTGGRCALHGELGPRIVGLSRSAGPVPGTQERTKKPPSCDGGFGVVRREA